MNFLDHIIQETISYIQQIPKELRKPYGQFFTNKETARFMASLFAIPPQHTLSILDPGAGTGILSASLLERLQQVPFLSRIQLDCYETDPKVIPLLTENLSYIQKIYPIPIEYHIITDNYITSQQADYIAHNTSVLEKYDMILANPPYQKINKISPEAIAMPDILHGTTNRYALFCAMSLANLKPNGELVYILPRSWTSGTYFSRFREKLLSSSILTHIHLFSRRTGLFQTESIRQETMILKLKKTNEKPNTITITTTESSAKFSKKTTHTVPYSLVFSPTHTILPVSNKIEIDTVTTVSSFTNTLSSLHLPMKTGLVVNFRNQDILRDDETVNTIPVFYPHHIQNGTIQFPKSIKQQYLLPIRKGIIQPNANYLFVKRFTSKEEPRRLQCGIYLKDRFPQYPYISTQDKLNFISTSSLVTLFGLYVLFNSTLYDRYYRILDGSTQINSTEINQIPVPSLTIIDTMGEILQTKNSFTTKTCDEILSSYI